MAKCQIDIPDSLHHKAKLLAVQSRSTLRKLVLRGLCDLVKKRAKT